VISHHNPQEYAMTTTARSAHLRDLLVDELTAYTRRSTNAENLLLSIGQDCSCTEDDEDAECTCLDDDEARAQAASWATLAAAAATTMQALSALVVAEEATA
jgi:hypothetical protein